LRSNAAKREAMLARAATDNSICLHFVIFAELPGRGRRCLATAAALVVAPTAITRHGGLFVGEVAEFTNGILQENTHATQDKQEQQEQEDHQDI
jgi:hypothetical protein